MISLVDIDTGTAIALAAVFVNLVSVLTAAAWGISRIQGTTAQLREAIRGLRSAVDSLEKTVNHLDVKFDDHSERIVRLETKGNTG